MFWVARVHRLNGWPRISSQFYFATMTETLRFCVAKFNLLITPPRSVTEIGSEELRQLIDYELSSCRSMPVSENHILGWCCGRVCAVRPGALGKPDKSLLSDGRYLKWSDIAIVRLEGTGKFQAEISFGSMKTNTNDPEKLLQKGEMNRKLVCNITPPSSSENLIFSIVHWLLIIAIRRGILVNINSLDDLFSQTQRHIMVKPEFLNDPVLLAAGPRGLNVIPGKPLGSSALTTFLKGRGQKVGFPADITFYSFRRRTATELALVLSPDVARAVMNHDASSKELEKYYFNILPLLNLQGISLGEDPSMAPQAISNERSLSLNALNDASLRRIHGPALAALQHKLMANDPDLPVNGTKAEMKNYKRRVRRIAAKVLFSEEVQQQHCAITVADYENREQNVRSCCVVEKLLQRARCYMQDRMTAPPRTETMRTPSTETTKNSSKASTISLLRTWTTSQRHKGPIGWMEESTRHVVVVWTLPISHTRSPYGRLWSRSWRTA